MENNEIFISQNFKNFEEMESSVKSWQYKTSYKMLPSAYTGKHHAVFLPTMQLSYSEQYGGFLHDVRSPKGMMTVAVIVKNEGKACFGKTKLKENMIVFFDDKRSYTMINNAFLKVSIFSFSKKAYRELSRELAKHTGEVIEDRDNVLQKILNETLDLFKNDPHIQQDIQKHTQIEERLIQTLDTLLQTQTPHLPKLTKGEKIALEIRDRIYRRMHGKITISSLAKEYDVSEQTLQNAFKSLFGFTPNIFIRHLKLNHVCRALLKADPKTDTIVRISKKWGFTHMGHFSRYFTELFGQNPSITLGKKYSPDKKHIEPL